MADLRLIETNIHFAFKLRLLLVSTTVKDDSLEIGLQILLRVGLLSSLGLNYWYYCSFIWYVFTFTMWSFSLVAWTMTNEKKTTVISHFCTSESWSISDMHQNVGLLYFFFKSTVLLATVFKPSVLTCCGPTCSTVTL